MCAHTHREGERNQGKDYSNLLTETMEVQDSETSL